MGPSYDFAPGPPFARTITGNNGLFTVKKWADIEQDQI